LGGWGHTRFSGIRGLGDGNQSDKKEFAEVLKRFNEQWQFDGLYIADSALYSADNLKKLTGIKWLCCVPKTIKSVQDLLTELASEQFITTDLAGYRLTSVGNEYGGVKQPAIPNSECS
jgi:transposase